MLISVVIPCYNEAEVIEKTFLLIVNILLSYGYKEEDLEVVFVIEKSEDDTLEKVMSLKEHLSFVKVLANDKKYGKGYSVKKGILASEGEYILVLDADLPINLEKYLKIMFELIKSPSSAAVYATAIWDKIDFKKRNFIRSITSLGLLILRRLILNQDISDSQLGCKLYRSEPVKRIINEVNINGFLYEILLTDLLFREGFNIEECAVRIDIFSDKSSVKVSDIFSSIFMFFKYVYQKRKKVLSPCTSPQENYNQEEDYVTSKQENKLIKYNRFLGIVIFVVLISLLYPSLQHTVIALKQNYTLSIIEKQEADFTQEPQKNVITYQGSIESQPNVPPGQGGTPPGHGGNPPGHGGTPPGHGGKPPGHRK